MIGFSSDIWYCFWLLLPMNSTSERMELEVLGVKRLTNFLAKFRLSKNRGEALKIGFSFFLASFQKVCKSHFFQKTLESYKHLFLFKFQMPILWAFKKC